MRVQDLIQMMYPHIHIHIIGDNKQELYDGTVSELPEAFLQKEIKHVWGQADLDGMKICIEP